MLQTNQHGMTYSFYDHMKIHDDVLKKFETLMDIPQEYKLEELSKDVLRHLVEFKLTHNNYKIKIEKKSLLTFKKDKSGKAIPDTARTIYYNYVARNRSKNHSIRYDCPHDDHYDKDVPWHNKNHRHEEFNSDIEYVKIYSHDDRPVREHNKKKFQVKKKMISIKYCNDDDWPHVQQFLDEIVAFS